MTPEDFTLMAPVEDEITPASFTDKIYPTEGIDIRVTHHFLQRWNQRLGNRSPAHLNQAIENKEVRYMCRGMDNSFHFLYRDQYNQFYAIIVGPSGGLQTILPANYYCRHFDSVNLSTHIEAFTQRDKVAAEETKVVQDIPSVPPEPVITRTVNESEYMEKISRDANLINQLNEHIRDLETTIANNNSSHNRKIETLKKQLENAIKHEDEVCVKVLSKASLHRPIISNPECIAYTLVAAAFFHMLVNMF